MIAEREAQGKSYSPRYCKTGVFQRRLKALLPVFCAFLFSLYLFLNRAIGEADSPLTMQTMHKGESIRGVVVY